MIPDDELRKIPRREVIQKALQQETAERLSRIDEEFADGFNLINKYNDSVTFFGSAMPWTESNPYYQKAREIAGALSEEGYAIVTGGGPGIMEAANRGAQEAGGVSIGLGIHLPAEEGANPYVTESINFRYFFTRKVMLAFGASAYIFFPGGYGTFDEFFEVITLIKTKKMQAAPIILVGTEFWTGLDLFIRTYLLQEMHTINPGEEELYSITDDIHVIRALINNHRDKSSPLALPQDSDITPLSQGDLLLTQ